jgi:murein DD-endopeptidase MepM/ murein hydrolase activator NlpD
LRIYLEYWIAALLWSLLNPFGLRQMVIQSGGQLAASARALRQGTVAPEVGGLRLPFNGTWKVYNGGVTRETSHSWGLVAQRYAYDFVVVGNDGRTYTGDPKQPQRYLAFGQPILAAGDGVVVEVLDGIRDAARANTGWIDWRTRDIRGNYVTIRHGDRAFTLYAHLQCSSVCVKVGDPVRQGQEIGRCGHSGHSTEPHLHFQLQDRANFHVAVGLPVRLEHFERRLGAGAPECVSSGFAAAGQLVRNVECEDEAVREQAQFAGPTLGSLIFNSLMFLLMLLGLGVLVLRLVDFLL